MRFLKEPLFHFFVLGIAIFVWFSMLDTTGETSAGPEIIVDDQDIDRLVEQFTATWNRPPKLAELDRLLDAQVREEMLVREARSLGLDRGDSVIRNRLTQKMNFLMTSLAQSAEPDDTTLQDYMMANSEAFLQPGQLAFQQISFGEDADLAQIKAALDALNKGADPATFGTISLLPAEISLTSRHRVESVFGRGFFDQLEASPDGIWSGPVRSGYGPHLVFVSSRKPPELPPYEEIRDEVLSDWRRTLSASLAQSQVDDLMDRYQIRRPSRDELAARLQQ